MAAECWCRGSCVSKTMIFDKQYVWVNIFHKDGSQRHILFGVISCLCCHMSYCASFNKFWFTSRHLGFLSEGIKIALIFDHFYMQIAWLSEIFSIHCQCLARHVANKRINSLTFVGAFLLYFENLTVYHIEIGTKCPKFCRYFRYIFVNKSVWILNQMCFLCVTGSVWVFWCLGVSHVIHFIQLHVSGQSKRLHILVCRWSVSHSPILLQSKVAKVGTNWDMVAV